MDIEERTPNLTKLINEPLPPCESSKHDWNVIYEEITKYPKESGDLINKRIDVGKKHVLPFPLWQALCMDCPLGIFVAIHEKNPSACCFVWDKNGWNMLHAAHAYNNTDTHVLKHIAQKHPLLLRALDDDGMTPLHMLCDTAGTGRSFCLETKTRREQCRVSYQKIEKILKLSIEVFPLALNMKDSQGRTPHILLDKDSEEIHPDVAEDFLDFYDWLGGLVLTMNDTNQNEGSEELLLEAIEYHSVSRWAGGVLHVIRKSPETVHKIDGVQPVLAEYVALVGQCGHLSTMYRLLKKKPEMLIGAM